MNITVFGASGGIGSQVVALAVQRGHHIRAVYREAPRTPLPGQAEVLLAADIFDPDFASEAIRGAGVVVAAVGPNFATRHNPRTVMTSPPDLHQRLARTLITAMRDSAAPARLITVSTASMGPADDVMGPGPRLLFRFFRTVAVPNLGRVGQDLRAMEDELAASGLDWYALRPVKLTDGPPTGHVRASDRFRMKAISRADVAWHILALAEDPAPGRHRTPVITTGTGRTPPTAAGGRDTSTRAVARLRAGSRILPRVRAGIVPGCGAGEPGEEVPPAGRVDLLLARGRPRWTSRRRVPAGVGVRVNSTSVAPGGMSVLPATPQLTRSRRGGSISRYRPRTGTPLMSTSKAPPGTGLRTACWPIQRTMAAGSVRCRKTSSGGAGRSTSVANASVTGGFPARCRVAGVGQRGAEPGQVLGPEAGQELLHGAEAVGVDHEQVAGARLRSVQDYG
jgi:putative NADH-flavin reductase